MNTTIYNKFLELPNHSRIWAVDVSAIQVREGRSDIDIKPHVYVSGRHAMEIIFTDTDKAARDLADELYAKLQELLADEPESENE